MANGYDLGDINYSDILGAQGGGQSLANIMGSLGQMLTEQGEFANTTPFGTEYMGSDIGWGGGTETGAWMTDPYSFWQSGYGPGELPSGWSNLMFTNSPSGSGYEEGATYTPEEFSSWIEDWAVGQDITPYDYMQGDTIFSSGLPSVESDYNLENLMQGLGQASEAGGYGGGFGVMEDLLQTLNIPGLQAEYGKDVGELRSEMGAQMKGLTSGLAGGKGGRYGGLGTSARNLGQGGRQKYMADVYGLQQQQGEMTAEMQQGLEENFMNAISNWQSLQ